MTAVPERARVSESLTLKPISKAAIPRALEKAERYRLLSDPEQAESICLDILAAQPGDQHTLTVLILAITDQFGREGSAGARHANEYVTRLDDEYQRHYYGGLVLERQARAYLTRGKSRVAAYDCFRDAMDHYEKAERLRPEDDDSAVLRWNACLRTIRRGQLQPPPADEREQPLE
jgi:tetratricopeptide (TPR) repeat protein